MLRIFRAIGAELNIAATNTIPPLNPSRKGSEPSPVTCSRRRSRPHLASRWKRAIIQASFGVI
jgi:hypothetical protein